jgi:hypothetical protein
MTSELLGLGLDKADVQNENLNKPAYKNISCTEHRTTGLDTDYEILTEPMHKQYGFHR